jgi:hypothetical protein
VIAELREVVGDGVHDELMVAVALLGFLPRRGRPGGVGRRRLLEESGLVLGEEIELALDHVGETPSAEPHTSSR